MLYAKDKKIQMATLLFNFSCFDESQHVLFCSVSAFAYFRPHTLNQIRNLRLRSGSGELPAVWLHHYMTLSDY